ncbi:hypothetical protein VNO78_34298 [Psophocarpus tetragonolobus]|uniref:Uncharacterized protein n=1 Tax=Psophocarpus tetragonolobus TaxID=3891 RepID=A0AAN9P0A5_PSOTE
MATKDPSPSLYLFLEIMMRLLPYLSKSPSSQLRDIISSLVGSTSSISDLIFSTAASLDLGDMEFASLLWSMWRKRLFLLSRPKGSPCSPYSYHMGSSP